MMDYADPKVTSATDVNIFMRPDASERKWMRVFRPILELPVIVVSFLFFCFCLF